MLNWVNNHFPFLFTWGGVFRLEIWGFFQSISNSGQKTWIYFLNFYLEYYVMWYRFALCIDISSGRFHCKFALCINIWSGRFHRQCTLCINIWSGTFHRKFALCINISSGIGFMWCQPPQAMCLLCKPVPMAPVSLGHLTGRSSTAPRPSYSVLPSVSPIGTHRQSREFQV